MAKIRVQDLARNMGLDNQDLVFKLKSIGVRVEGDEALIDTEIIQAILQGKRLPQPREVILRDDDAPAPAPPTKRAPIRRPTGARPRRSMIQRVERPIREIEVRKGHPDHRAEDAIEETPEAAEIQGIVTEHPVATELAPETIPTGAEEQPPASESGPDQAAAPAPKSATAPEAETKAEPVKDEGVKAEPASPEPAKAEPVKAEPVKAEPVKAEPAKAQPAKAQPAKVEKKPAGVQGKPQPKAPAAQPRPRADQRPSPPPSKVRPVAPGRTREVPSRRPDSRLAGKGPGARPGASRPGGGRGQQDARRGRRGVPPRQDYRAAPRPAAKEEPQRAPVSARGLRRAKRRQDEPVRSSAGIKFKDDRPSGPVTISEGMTVREYAEKLGVKAKDLIRALVMRGIMANINHVLDMETAKMLADELGVDVMEVSFEEEVQLLHESNVDAEKASRAPVVTVMGHVDHGKTTLLDRIRSAKVAEGEAGGITQHIGAYHVDVDDRQIVFLDTPGHEAFTMMRARGASVTDIVILVVAADDSVMPQTVEAINHAKAAKVPIVVAINKIDKANANLDRVRKELADHGLLLEDWGGDIVSVPVSALRGERIDDLLEMVLLTSEILDLQASPGLPASGAVLEARKEIGKGIVATVLVQNGTLRTGDTFVAGSTWGKVRIMTDDRGNRLKQAGPATPVEVTGFTDVPGAGDVFQVMEDESKARSIAELRKDEERQRELRPMPLRASSLEQLFSQSKDEVKELPIIIKADVDGSVEVLRETLQKLSTEKVKINILHAAVGAISNNDVILASASNALIVGFNVRPERNAAALAEKKQVDIRLHTVIYELSDELKRAMTGLLEPVFREVQTGTAEVRDTFKIPKLGVIAGAHIIEGSIPRSAMVRLLRDNVVVWEGKIGSLKRFKEDVSEVRSGFDCGIGLERFQDIKPGDYIEAFTREEVAPAL